MLSSLSPSTPIRNSHYNHSIKVAAPSPRSVQSPTTYFSHTETNDCSQEETTKRMTNSTMNKTVEGQVSFRSAARRFSCHATVVVPPSPMSVKPQLPPSAVPRTPNTTGSTHHRRKVGPFHVSSQPPQQQRHFPLTIPTMEPLDIDDTETVKRNLSFRTLAQRFAAKNRNKDTAPQNQSQVFEKQQRRNSTGFYDPRMTPSFAAPAIAQKSVTVDVSSPIRPSRRSSINYNEINTIPLVSPIPTTKVFTPLSSPVKGNQNEYLNNNKVFQKRYNTAATTLQRVYRGHVQRHEVARLRSALRIQSIVREFVQRRKVQKHNVATLIQRMFRGFATRQRSKVYQLEYQLYHIQQCHARELQDIQNRKEEELRCINKVIGQEHIKYMEEKQKLEKTINDANRIIKHLRKENKKIRDKNETLRVAIDQLIEENEMLEQQAHEYKLFAANLDQMKLLNNENEALISVIAQFEHRKQQFDEAIEKRDEFIMYENQMGRLYLHQIQEMVALVEETCIDPYLVAYIEELCIKCNLPGTGLEASVADDAMDMSERKYEM